MIKLGIRIFLITSLYFGGFVLACNDNRSGGFRDRYYKKGEGLQGHYKVRRERRTSRTLTLIKTTKILDGRARLNDYSGGESFFVCSWCSKRAYCRLGRPVEKSHREKALFRHVILGCKLKQ